MNKKLEVNVTEGTVKDVMGIFANPVVGYTRADVTKAIAEELKTYKEVIKDAEKYVTKFETDREFYNKQIEIHGLQTAIRRFGTKKFIAEVESVFIYEIVESIILDKFYGIKTYDAVHQMMDYHQTLAEYQEKSYLSLVG